MGGRSRLGYGASAYMGIICLWLVVGERSMTARTKRPIAGCWRRPSPLALTWVALTRPLGKLYITRPLPAPLFLRLATWPRPKPVVLWANPPPAIAANTRDHARSMAWFGERRQIVWRCLHLLVSVTEQRDQGVDDAAGLQQWKQRIDIARENARREKFRKRAVLAVHHGLHALLQTCGDKRIEVAIQDGLGIADFDIGT